VGRIYLAPVRSTLHGCICASLLSLPFKGRVREGMGYFDHSHMHATALGTIVPGEGFLEGLDPAFQTVLLISKGVDGESNSLST
jgi:hypothetical protein